MSLRILTVLRNWLRRAVVAVAAFLVIAAAMIAWLLYDRPSLDAVSWIPRAESETIAGAVTVTWFGVSTLLFDDGNTQILIDGFFSRPSLADIVFGIPVDSDASQINYVLDKFQLRRLAAIIPAHSHFDHAMDIGAIANRSSASILGSETSAQIARGASVPEDQIVVVANGAQYSFGEFTVSMFESLHAPIAWGGSTPYAGSLSEPLQTPAPVSAWKEGGSYSILVSHPQGTTLVQASAGYVEGNFNNLPVDVVMLGTFGLDRIGRDYTENYWRRLVTSTGASRVFPIHFDDYTRPFGTIELFPRILDNFLDTARALEEIRETWDTDTRIELPEFGTPIVLYAHDAPEA